MSPELLAYILFIPGFYFLVKGADLLVDGSSSIARRFGVPSIIIGLTVVAFGTSLPELIVNLMSAIGGNTDIALGNILGSNIANILLIMGMTAAFCPLNIKAETAWKEIPYCLMAIVIMFVLANDLLIDGLRKSSLTRSDGIVMLCFFGFFLYYLIENTMNRKDLSPEAIEKTCDGNTREGGQAGSALEKPGNSQSRHVWKSVLMIIAGVVALYFGGRWVVGGAITAARRFNLSEFMISATIIAIGTSLPELVTSIIAAIKKEPDLSVGNIVGSNIFNTLFVLPVTSVIKTIPVNPAINNDIIFCMLTTLFLFLFLFLGKKYKLERWQGIFFVVLYVFYMVYVVMRG